jgi:outer membrane protein assembly factor BamD
MTIARLFRIRVLLLALLFASCAGNGVNPAAMSADELFQQASGYYEAGNLGRAIPLMESFVQLHFGDPRAPDVRMWLGQAYQRRRQWITAASHFQRLIEDYPSSPHEIPARFAICESYYRLSPPAQLDQEYTYAGIAHCESVATTYSQTEQGTTAGRYLDEMRNKLAKKVYDAGAFYVRRRAYDAAVVYFQDVLENFPQTIYAPAALLSLVETFRELGYVEEAEATEQRLRQEYPDSAEARGLGG